MGAVGKGGLELECYGNSFWHKLDSGGPHEFNKSDWNKFDYLPAVDRQCNQSSSIAKWIKIMIKKLFISSIVAMTALGILADANRERQTPKSKYDKTSPPLVLMADAHALALRALGAETNQYYCVSATCLNPLPDRINAGSDNAGWLFEFSNTNGVEKRVAVYFDRVASIVGNEGPFGQ